ncbi:MAG TPA: beta-propeller fold lactonase family protein [Terriglobales bacterium]|nr:beta-propeller fold lactonase family protein [Terriglobales bacterium]
MSSRLTAGILILLMAAAAVSCGSGSSHGSHPAYVTVPGNNHVVGFNIDNKSGALSIMSGSPFATGNSPSAVTVHPSKKFAYVTNAADATVSLYTIGTSGVLTEVMPRVATGTNPTALTVDPGGSFLFAANAGSNSISVYSINSSTGALSEISGSPFPATSPRGLVVTPSGKFLYAANATSGSVSVFTIQNTGALAGGAMFSAGLKVRLHLRLILGSASSM